MDYMEKHYLKKLVFENGKDTFTIKRYCELANLTRGMFYWKYGSCAGFFAAILERDLYTCALQTDRNNSASVLKNMLKAVYKDWELYFWMYQNTSHKDHQNMKVRLTEVMRGIISSCANRAKGISEKKLKQVTEGIYDHLLSLILHNCKKDFLDAFSMLQNYIPDIEGRS